MADLVCIGAPRAGTTWLFENLSAHPGVFLPDFKEMNFFRPRFPGDGCLGQSVEHYREQFAAAGERVSVDISPGLLGAPLAPVRIRRALPAVRLLVMLRDPVQRAVSHYNFVRSRKGFSFGPEALFTTKQGDRVFQDGLYGHYLTHYLREFERDRIHFEFTDAIKAEPHALLDRVCAFAGVEPHEDAGAAARHVNAPQGVRMRWLKRLQRRVAERLNREDRGELRQRLKETGLPQLIQKLNRSGSRSVWKPDPSQREKLENYFADDVLLLEELLGEPTPWGWVEKFREGGQP